jgi:hypothetical protein
MTLLLLLIDKSTATGSYSVERKGLGSAVRVVRKLVGRFKIAIYLN